MGWIERTIEEANGYLESSDIEAMKMFVKKVASFKDFDRPERTFYSEMGYYANGEDEQKVAWLHGDIRYIIESLTKKQEELAAGFAQRYGTATLDKHIERCRRTLAGTEGCETAEEICSHVACVYLKKIPGMRENLTAFSDCENKDFEGDVARLLEYLLVYRDDIIKSHKSPMSQFDRDDLLHALVKSLASK